MNTGLCTSDNLLKERKHCTELFALTKENRLDRYDTIMADKLLHWIGFIPKIFEMKNYLL